MPSLLRVLVRVANEGQTVFSIGHLFEGTDHGLEVLEVGQREEVAWILVGYEGLDLPLSVRVLGYVDPQSKDVGELLKGQRGRPHVPVAVRVAVRDQEGVVGNVVACSCADDRLKGFLSTDYYRKCKGVGSGGGRGRGCEV